MENKKQYIIRIFGESSGHSVVDLTEHEYHLIKSILEDCESEYVGGSIEEIQSSTDK